MSEEELMLKSAIYAVERLLSQGYHTYYIKENDETYRVDYTDTMKYLNDRLEDLKESTDELERRQSDREADELHNADVRIQ